ncbi:MAG: ATP-binding protein, partial [Gluconobacter oxydans]
SEYVKKAVGYFKSFANAFNIKYGEFEFSIDPREGNADTGDITSDLTDLFVVVGEAAQNHQTAVAIIIDEIQYLSIEHMSAMVMAIHRCNQKRLPIIIFGAGLPQLRGKMGDAKSYVERLFDFPEIDALSPSDAARAISEPARKYLVEYEVDALQEIIRVTSGYPYFIQEWGHASWLAAPKSPITKPDVIRATSEALDRLDKSFFRVRLDRMTPTEKKIYASFGRIGARCASFGRYCSGIRCSSHQCGSPSFIFNSQRNAIQPSTWRHSVHRSFIR